jgi:hypothetical protein
LLAARDFSRLRMASICADQRLLVACDRWSEDWRAGVKVASRFEVFEQGSGL